MDIVIDIIDAEGTFEVRYIIFNNVTREDDLLFRENLTFTNEGVHLQYTFGTEIHPPIDNTFFYQFEVRIKDGSWKSLTHTSMVLY